MHAAPPVFALLDDASPHTGPGGWNQARSRLYRDYAGTLACHTIDEWPPLLARLQDALARGLYAVPVLGYELGEQLLGVAAGTAGGMVDGPLVQVLLFARYEELDGDGVAAWLAQCAEADRAGPAGIAAVRANVDQAAFERAIGAIHDYIEAGDTYQVNYTYRLRFDAFGSVFALYARLRARQPVPYGALVGLPDGRTVLSLSPELFVRHDAGRLLARPMKGTARAGRDAADTAARAEALSLDPKNRAENLMIVDLLRNDLGRIARTGSVGVPALFEVRPYGRVLQMTSTIQAQLAPGTGLAAIFDALYPCGSITGAPKRRTMEIIHELEPAARGIYTGALGWIDPPASQPAAAAVGDFCLSVPIRTLVLQPEHGGVRHGELGVGAGIVHDSDAGAEYAECQLKASFLTGLPNDFELFETMYATREDGCRHLERHLARLQASSAYFGYPFQPALARAGVLAACSVLPAGAPHRLRLSLQPDGEVMVRSGPLAPLQEPVRLLLADDAVDADDLFLRHKTSIRGRYDAAWRAAESMGAFDTLFFNTRGELTEGGRSNVFVRVKGRWYTPPLSAGVLPGVMRAVLLDDPAWNAIEVPITRETLLRAQEIVVCNALRGPLRAVLADGVAHPVRA
jgi:para-aminobenzoate synthetase/4-amino-4-deoxychorismate lyase